MLPPPHPMPAGLDADDYYRGNISGPTDDQQAWVQAHEHRDTGESEPATGVQTEGEAVIQEARR
ncbi:hypothetical protein GCM10025868_31100 [Angustibacter aerolatus]|uniref:Uncharacterized protein n=1 Tax=Angustibacter aerolatus TaxID=1162965 RepID=A0ABQ6JKT0_9ACTN|nr:hypothetical protein GCM10025868_31100 [Angustibacter aerolatus]